MGTFIIEAAVICLLFTVMCISLAGRTMKNPEAVKLNYPEPIVRRLIEQGRISDDKPLSIWQRIKKKWRVIVVFGVLLGLIVRYINGCAEFLSGFGTAYLLWVIVDWYDAFVIDCGWFCHSGRCVIAGTIILYESKNKKPRKSLDIMILK